jgi:hypothetical protein
MNNFRRAVLAGDDVEATREFIKHSWDLLDDITSLDTQNLLQLRRLTRTLFCSAPPSVDNPRENVLGALYPDIKFFYAQSQLLIDLDRHEYPPKLTYFIMRVWLPRYDDVVQQTDNKLVVSALTSVLYRAIAHGNVHLIRRVTSELLEYDNQGAVDALHHLTTSEAIEELSREDQIILITTLLKRGAEKNDSHLVSDMTELLERMKQTVDELTEKSLNELIEVADDFKHEETTSSHLDRTMKHLNRLKGHVQANTAYGIEDMYGGFDFFNYADEYDEEAFVEEDYGEDYIDEEYIDEQEEDYVDEQYIEDIETFEDNPYAEVYI